MDRNYDGDATHLSNLDIRDIRDRFYNDESVESLSVIFGVSSYVVERILDGHIQPFAGGALRALPLQGCNPRFQESTRNRQRFVRGIIKRAKAVLTPEEFEVFSNFNGMSVADANNYAKNSEDLDGRLAQERYRGVLSRHAQGASLEQSVIAHSRRARAIERDT